MAILLEVLPFVLGGAVLAWLLIQIFGRSGDQSRTDRQRPVVKLMRTPVTPDGVEQTRLTINNRVILTASNEGLHPAAYADEIEYVEAIATRIASALDVSVSLERAAARQAQIEEEILTHHLPRHERKRGSGESGR